MQVSQSSLVVYIFFSLIEFSCQKSKISISGELRAWISYDFVFLCSLNGAKRDTLRHECKHTNTCVHVTKGDWITTTPVSHIRLLSATKIVP